MAVSHVPSQRTKEPQETTAGGEPAHARLDIRILGPLRVAVRGIAVEPSDAQQRRLLALFAVYADHVVPPHLILEELWPDGPPPGAMSELHRRVADLRTHIDQADAPVCRPFTSATPARRRGSRLAAVAGGYRFDSSHATLDVRQFWRDSGAGIRALAMDDVDTAVRRLGSALRLWNGEALAGLTLGIRLRREAKQLADARERAVEQWLEAELRHDGVQMTAGPVGSSRWSQSRYAASAATATPARRL
ncbi:BTAD domain-containing putative transcriptional regulator [Streptomyces albidoflavus]